MSDANPHPGMDLSSIKTLVSQLKIQDLVNAIRTVTMNDIERVSNVARGRELNVDTMKLLFEEATKLHNTGNAMIAIGLVICVILLIFPMAVTTPFLATLGFTSVGPAAGIKSCYCSYHVYYSLTHFHSIHCGYIPVSLWRQCGV
jgi:hypothetical protein